jgi:hypothetical protein
LAVEGLCLRSGLKRGLEAVILEGVGLDALV